MHQVVLFALVVLVALVTLAEPAVRAMDLEAPVHHLNLNGNVQNIGHAQILIAPVQVPRKIEIKNDVTMTNGACKNAETMSPDGVAEAAVAEVVVAAVVAARPSPLLLW